MPVCSANVLWDPEAVQHGPWQFAAFLYVLLESPSHRLSPAPRASLPRQMAPSAHEALLLPRVCIDTSYGLGVGNHPCHAGSVADRVAATYSNHRARALKDACALKVCPCRPDMYRILGFPIR